MQAVGHLVGLDADQRGPHLVDRAVERRSSTLPKSPGTAPGSAGRPSASTRCCGRRGSRTGGSATRAAPSRRRGERRPLERLVDAVLVRAVPALVHGGEEAAHLGPRSASVRRMSSIPMLDANGCAVRSKRQRAVEAERSSTRSANSFCCLRREVARETRVVDVLLRRLGDDRLERRLAARRRPRAPRPSSCRARSRRAVRRTGRRRREAVDVLAAGARGSAPGAGGAARRCSCARASTQTA